MAEPLRVGLNLVFLVPDEVGGMEVYARELVAQLVACAPGVRFTAFINREASEAGGGPWGSLLPAVTVPVRARRRTEWVRGEQALLPRLAAREGVHLVHSLASTAPVWGRFARVVTVHDLIYARVPEAHAGLRALGMRALVPLAVRRAQRVIADSRNTRDDLVSLLHTPPEKIDVIPLGIGQLARVEAWTPARTRDEFGLGDRRVLLSLSAKRPHKNLRSLIGALARLPVKDRPLLVIPGYATWHERELHEQAESLGVAGDVRMLDWVPDGALEGLWGVADVFVYPSLYEGFGLPVLEAMARGVPVACADASSLPEVVGDAALLFDPHDETAIAAAITRLLDDPAEAQRRREAGLARAGEFSWERTARATLDSYRRALGRPSLADAGDG